MSFRAAWQTSRLYCPLTCHYVCGINLAAQAWSHSYSLNLKYHGLSLLGLGRVLKHAEMLQKITSSSNLIQVFTNDWPICSVYLK